MRIFFLLLALSILLSGCEKSDSESRLKTIAQAPAKEKTDQELFAEAVGHIWSYRSNDARNAPREITRENEGYWKEKNALDEAYIRSLVGKKAQDWTCYVAIGRSSKPLDLSVVNPINCYFSFYSSQPFMSAQEMDDQYPNEGRHPHDNFFVLNLNLETVAMVRKLYYKDRLKFSGVVSKVDVGTRDSSPAYVTFENVDLEVISAPASVTSAIKP